jgi:hypothetical protein
VADRVPRGYPDGVPTDADIATLQARLIARLRAGGVLGASDKEVRWELRAEGAGFVYEAHDQLAIGAPPMERRELPDDDAVRAWLSGSASTPQAWADLLARVDGPTPSPLSPEALDGLIAFGALPDGPAWTAFAEGVVPRWLAGAMRPHLRDATPDQPPSAGPFCWLLPLPPSAPAGAAYWLDAEVTGRLAERLALARRIDLTAPTAFEGGRWSARHADRYETDGMGFLVSADLLDGRRVEVPVDLARPGTDDPVREVPAARTRIRKALLRALRP